MITLAYRIAARLRIIYWFAFRPTTRGVKCVVSHDGRWLMIRNSYGRGYWTLPGGAVKRNEDPQDAAVREVREEVGIQLNNLTAIGSYETNRQYKHDTVFCFRSEVDSPKHTIDNKEVIESRWFGPEDLPADRGVAVNRILAMVKT